jgi:hypothetical protein
VTRCVRCDFESPDGLTFCGQCGACRCAIRNSRTPTAKNPDSGGDLQRGTITKEHKEIRYALAQYQLLGCARDVC